MGVLGLLAVWTLTGADDFWVSVMTDAVIFGVIFLSVTVFTGLGGQISLAQASFAAVGAFTAMQLADRWDVSVLAGALSAAPSLPSSGWCWRCPCCASAGSGWRCRRWRSRCSSTPCS